MRKLLLTMIISVIAMLPDVVNATLRTLALDSESTLWSGKKVSILGDSYSTFEGSPGSGNSYYFPEGYVGQTKEENIFLPQSGMWWAQVISHFGGELSVNCSVGGSPMTDCYSQDNFYERVSLVNNKLGSPDIIFVFGGMNDHWMYGNQLSTDGLFESGIETLFDYLKSSYSSAKIYVIVNKKHEGESWTEWGITDMQRSVLSNEAAERGFSVIDLQGYFATENSDINQARYPHPTAQGQTKIANRVISFIEANSSITGHSHQFGATVTNVAATCTNEGYTVSTCIANGCSEPAFAVTNSLAMLAHTPGDWEEGQAGTEVQKCTFCNQVVNSREASSSNPPSPTSVGEELLIDGGFEAYDDKLVNSQAFNWIHGLEGAWEGWSANAWNCPFGVWVTRKGQGYWTKDESMNGSLCSVLQVKEHDVWIAQEVPGISAGTYRISFIYQRRSGNTASQRFAVSLVGDIGSVQVGSEITISDNELHTFSQDVTITAGDWTLRVDSFSETEDVSTLFDDFSMKALGGDVPPVEHTHIMSEAVTIVEATCTNEGYKVSTCIAEGCTDPIYETTNVISKLSHTPGDWEVEIPAEIGKAGTEVCKCIVCGQVVDSRDISPIVPPPPPISSENWGYSNTISIAGTDYCVVVFTNTTGTITWQIPQEVSMIDYLVVGGGAAGGASGNAYGAGGGGAGGVIEAMGIAVDAGTTMTVTVGAGGTSVTSGIGNDGVASTLNIDGLSTICALPGAGGGKGAGNGQGGENYACGGGAGGNYARETDPLLLGGDGTISRGGDGKIGAGGGGAGGNGLSSEEGGTGGSGVAVTIFDGTELRIAGGGSGTLSERALNPAPDGGGSGGVIDPYTQETAATAGTTWGAGGGGGKNESPSGAGHQGVVVIRYTLGGEPVPQKDDVVPGEVAKVYATEAAARAAIPASVTPSAAIATSLNEGDVANYKACFTIETRENADGGWINEAVLLPAIAFELQEQVDMGAVQVVSALTEETVFLSTVTPGFYYGLDFGETISTMEKQTPSLATSTDGLALTLPKGESSGFYRVTVSISAE